MRREWFVFMTLSLVILAVNTQAKADDAPLAEAAEKSDRERLRQLVERGVDVNQAQVDGMTALHWSAFVDDLETAKLLIGAKADVRAANRYGVTPLSMACTNGNGPMVEMFLKAGADPNTKLSGDETALMTAARTGKLGPVKALIARGAEVNAKERRGQTALMWAASEGHAEVISELLRADADFRTPLPSGFTPLFFAVREGHPDVVKIFLKAGADVNEAMQIQRPASRGPSRGTSPLILAVENGHFDLAVDLLDAGADPNDQRSGFTALHMLTWVRKPNRGDGDDDTPTPIGSGKLTSLQFVESLDKHGADVNVRLKRGASGRGVLGRTGASPFLLSAMTADLPYMKILLKLGADPFLTNSDRCSPLMAAAGVGSLAPGEEAGTEDEALEAVKLLIDLGGDVNAVDANGETAMHGAAYKSMPSVAQLLADRGAKVDLWNRKNKYGWTPLAIAEGHRPGNFKPSTETSIAILRLMLASGLIPPNHPTSGEQQINPSGSPKKAAP